MKVQKLLAVALTALSAVVAFGVESGDPRTFYVAASGGSDDNDGTSRDAPFATFAHGVLALRRNGDKLVVLKGHHYLDSTVPQCYNYAGWVLPNKTEIVGETEDRTETVIDGCGKYRGFYWLGASGQLVANLTFQNLGNGQDFTDDSEGGTPFRTLASNCVLSNCVFRNICVTNQVGTGNQSWTPLYVGGANNTIVDCDFIANTNTGAKCGGIYMSEGVGHVFVRCRFLDNYVYNKGVVDLSVSGSQYGNFTDCLFKGNHAQVNPACVFLGQGEPSSGTPSIFTRCDFVDNVCSNGTATVFCERADSGGSYWHADAGFYDCAFSNNVAARVGGNLIRTGCVTVFSTNGFHGCTFSNNWNYSTSTYQAAAGIELGKQARTSIVERCVFRDNHAMSTGGTALEIECGGARIEDCIFEDNVAHGTAEGGGGAVRVASGFGQFDRCVFRRNRGPSRGGAVNLYDGSFGSYEPCWMRNCLFEGNYASGDGAAIAGLFGTPMVIENCTFITNKTAGSYGAIYGRAWSQTLDANVKWCVSNCLFYSTTTKQSKYKSIYITTHPRYTDAGECLKASLKCGNNYMETARDTTHFPAGERNNIFSNADPFTSLAGGDLSPSKTAGARDAAAVRPWMTNSAKDVWGAKRLSGKASAAAVLPDIGAVEYQYRYGAMIIFR